MDTHLCGAGVGCRPQFGVCGDRLGHRRQQLTSGLGSRAVLGSLGPGFGLRWTAGSGSCDAGSWSWGFKPTSSSRSSAVTLLPLGKAKWFQRRSLKTNAHQARACPPLAVWWGGLWVTLSGLGWWLSSLALWLPSPPFVMYKGRSSDPQFT